MTTQFQKILIILIIFLFSQEEIISQERWWFNKLELGVNIGAGSQSYFPFKNQNYIYETNYIKSQINYDLFSAGKFNFELLIEPGYYRATHQLKNFWFIQPSRGEDYWQQRLKYTKKKSFNEYALNFGFVSRLNFTDQLSCYTLISVGPMSGSKHTERLIKGFAFSDILAVGSSYKIDKIKLDFRLTFRHTSNANTRFPNNGHNSVGLEGGVSYIF